MVLVPRDAEPGVGHFDPRELAIPVQAQLDVSALRRVLDRVVDEVRDHLAELVLVAGHGRHVLGGPHAELDAARQVKLGRVDDALRERDRVEPLVLEPQAAGV